MLLHKSFLIILLIAFSLLFSAAQGQVTYRDTLVTWSHFDYELDQDNGMDWYSTTEIVEEEYPGIVIENEYVRLVVLPGFGARILSFFYKPSGEEQFYVNPVGSPYGMGDGNFYYDWLMVFGGVFPTFPEPEHGKTWFLPWAWEFSEISDDRIVLTMEIQDTIDFSGHPWKFNNGVTEVRCISEVILEKGKTSFDLTHTLQNTKAQDVTMEYWTCTTLSPGSQPGNTFTPGNSEIVVPIDYVFLKDDWWSWMGAAEEPATGQGNHVFEYKNLAIYDNWEDMGIAYAYPELTGEYYGVINHENGSGVFRVANNETFTPGMKFWTWGAQQGLNADPNNFYDVARPYIELWSGLSTQFFEDATLSPNQTLSWTETYLPTLFMDTVSMVNASGALQVSTSSEGPDRFILKAFMTLPDTTFNMEADLSGPNNLLLYDENFSSQDDDCFNLTLKTDDYQIPDGSYDLDVVIRNEEGTSVLEYMLPVTIPFPTAGLAHDLSTQPRLKRISESMYQLQFSDPAKRRITVYTINGQIVSDLQVNDESAFIQLDGAGIYIVRVEEAGNSFSIKIGR